jgi:CHAD domain-containing protein
MKPRKKAPMVGGSVLRPGHATGDALRAAAHEIIAAADRPLADPAMADAEAVHEIRKALKRWRALLRLLGDILGGAGAQLRSEARDLMRALSQARDAQSAIDALADLRKTDGALSATSFATIAARLDEIKRAAEMNIVTSGTRERLHRYLDFAALSVDRWPLKKIDFEAIAEGLAFTYRRARSLVPKSWPDATPEELHNLRRRVVEHRHQMDLIEPLWPRLGHVWSQEAQRLRNRLGACQDLTVFAALIAPNHSLAPWRSRLAPAIAARRAAHIAAAARLAGRLFAEKPKAFRRRIAAMWSRESDARDARAQVDAAMAEKLAAAAKTGGAGKLASKKPKPVRAKKAASRKKPARKAKPVRAMKPRRTKKPARKKKPVGRRNPARGMRVVRGRKAARARKSMRLRRRSRMRRSSRTRSALSRRSRRAHRAAARRRPARLSRARRLPRR